MNREEKNKISRESILLASLKEFGEKDYSTASINNICKNNNISKGKLFHYYKNKDEVFLLCIEKLFIDLSSYLEEHFQLTQSNIEENLRGFVQKRFEFFKEYPHYEQIFLTVTFNPPKHLLYEIDTLRQPVKKINRHFWSKILNMLDLKTNIILEDTIEVIIGFGKYLHMKMQHENLLSVDETACMIEKYTKEYVNMVNMLLYGIVK
ncbi:TetR/AcrR family transcriptional regulator [Oceanirhabdus sp. W0125-5]|uniref:TetR/AcrR family transcriptional regulator n=1 Tax=Oceanirhabdus sp. W0125-5 TaxID=2999116 RepID=UPI0022F2E20D|nr:TetR/AcrR family transcriptional regulator [Oceanirhabdus sp. W0125-5]WBW96732.1 TetR/AcrR family transcriptional regulator [Oceanirhabdus sp. W0125-5]